MKRYKTRGRKTKTPAKTEFDFFYYEVGLTGQEMATKYGVSLKTIYNLASKYRALDAENEQSNE